MTVGSRQYSMASNLSFRDWAAKEADHLGEVIKAVLDNVVQNKVEAMYARPDLFERLR